MRVDKCVVYTCICISRLIVDVIDDIDTGKSICMCLMCLTHFFVSKFLRRGGRSRNKTQQVCFGKSTSLFSHERARSTRRKRRSASNIERQRQKKRADDLALAPSWHLFSGIYIEGYVAWHLVAGL